MRNRLLFGFLFIILILLDQVTKVGVSAFFHLGESREIIGNLLRLTYVRNPGGAFSVSFGGPQVMFVISVAVISLLVFLLLKGVIHPKSLAEKVAFTLVFAGAFGNFFDRVRMGEVVDFIDMGIGSHRWPVYNVADIAITCGMILLFFLYTRNDSRAETENVSV